jgi:hypothetical protein
MRRRRLFYIAATASAVLCIASGALWARSLKHHEEINLSFARYPRPNEIHAWALDFEWYSNTLRVSLFRETFGPRDWQWESSASSLRSAYPPEPKKGARNLFLDPRSRNRYTLPPWDDPPEPLPEDMSITSSIALTRE